ncbi:MAG: tetratricopeptide repeat protein [Neisseria sp.]|nr:tetratricopeptide repeat protein [Neisseria sp.]
MAAHLDDQQELENFKYFWQRWGRWLFAVLVAAAAAYLGWVVYQNHQKEKNQEAASVLAQLLESTKSKKDVKAFNAQLLTLQQDYPNSISAAQATMMAAAEAFDQKRYDVAEKHLEWVLKNQETPFVQVLAIQRLATVQLQQKKYDAALATLNRPANEAFASVILETRGDVLHAQGKKKEALAAYEQALLKSPPDGAGREFLQLKAEALK